MKQEVGTLKEGEPHPSFHDAVRYIFSLGFERLSMALEAYQSCAIEGNEHAEVCGETLRRLIDKEPVSDRYLLGLAWDLKRMEEV